MNASAAPAISPLAQRLAEENNVDWRALAGSRAGGTVNERDVLDYLEAVMLGQKPLDPTPEPLPEGLGAWLEEAERPPRAEVVEPVAGPPRTPVSPAARPAAPVRTFEAEYRAALAELTTLKAKLADAGTNADALQSKLAGLEAERATWQDDRLELGRLRRGAEDRDAALAKAIAKAAALEPQVAELKEALAKAQGETRKAQGHGFDLAARLNKLNDAQSKAEAENRRLQEANAGLEQTNAKLQNRPWWRFWG